MSGLRCLTVRQPWASLIAAGVKTIETRPWSTKHRGRIGIHAGKRLYTAADKHADPTTWWAALDALALERSGGVYDLPYGALVATAELVDCVRAENLIHESTAPVAEPWGHEHYIVDLDRQLPLGDFSPGRYVWLLRDIKPTTERCPDCRVMRGVALASCWTCKGAGHCPPIPAKGRQGLWSWTPEAPR